MNEESMIKKKKIVESKIRINHPDLIGSFTCLGVWFNILDSESVLECKKMLRGIKGGDLSTAYQEIAEAEKTFQFWKPRKHLFFLYKKFEKDYRENRVGFRWDIWDEIMKTF